MDTKTEDRLVFWGGIFVVLLVVAGVVFFIGHPIRKTPADKIAVSYGGGLFEGAQFQKEVNPASGLVFNGVFDKWYEYPVTQRNYIVSLTEGEGDRQVADAIQAFTADRVPVHVELTTTFKLNTNKIREFHEAIGLKFKAWEDAGWDKMLNDNFRQPLENSVQQVVRGFEVDQIASDPQVLVAIQETVQSTLKREVNTLLGGEYFCGPGFKVGEKDCPNFQVAVKAITLPEDIVNAFKAQEASAANIVTAENNAKAKAKTAEGEKAQKDVLSQSLTPEYLGYLKILAYQECAKNPNCVLVVDASGGSGNVNVNVPSGN